MGFRSVLLYSAAAASLQASLAAAEAYDYVDPLIGTRNGGMFDLPQVYLGSSLTRVRSCVRWSNASIW